MFRKTIILAMVLGVVAAMALLGAAGASWKHNGFPIQSNVQLPFTGTSIKFESSAIGGGMGCQVTSDVTLKSGQTTGTVTSFKAHPTSDTANCVGTGGFSFCQAHNLIPQAGFQWVVHTKSGTTSMVITKGEITAQTTGGFCPVKHILISAGTVEGHADGHILKTVQITGTAHVIADSVTDPAAPVTGLLHLEQTPTYEI